VTLRDRALGAIRLLGTAAKNLYFGHGAEWAAALAYYTLLSVFPAALLGVTLAAQFVNEGWAIRQIVSGVGRLLPTVSDTLARDVQEAVAQRGRVGVVALVVLLWTGSRVFSTLTHALDQALRRAHRIENLAISLTREIFLLGAMGVILFVGTLAGPALTYAFHLLPVAPSLAPLVTALSRIALFGGALTLLYSWVPYPRPPRRLAALGALVGTLVLVLAMPLFSAYVTQLGQYNLIYGPLAIVIVVLVWFWVASFSVLYGVHVVALLEAPASVPTAPGPTPASPDGHTP
jgi:membrane protein